MIYAIPAIGIMFVLYYKGSSEFFATFNSTMMKAMQNYNPTNAFGFIGGLLSFLISWKALNFNFIAVTGLWSGAIVILSAIASGFVGKFGGDIYEYIKQKKGWFKK